MEALSITGSSPLINQELILTVLYTDYTVQPHKYNFKTNIKTFLVYTHIQVFKYKLLYYLKDSNYTKYSNYIN
jgi:hypothetical protein